jgi:AraC family transcriptional regulator
VIAAPNGQEMNASAEILISQDVPMHDSVTPELSVIAAQLFEAAYKARDGDREAASAHIARAMALIKGLPSLGPRETPSPRVEIHRIERGALLTWQTRKVIAHVQGNLSRRILVQELAQLLGLSASHFCRALKCSFGATPREYVLRRRIEASQALMLLTTDSLGSIALKCGMCDQQHFTRSFHRIVGQAPSMWRRSRRESIIERDC